MIPVLIHERCALFRGEAADIELALPPDSVDALITDPPAGIGFMGKGWDKDKGGRAAWVAWLRGILEATYRVMKPGAHGLVWALPRTSHWTATACEDAGFEIRDRVSHLFGTGFPKSLNVGDGRGTALKPAVEDWWLIRKPLVGTVAANVLEHGTGTLNIDACRIGTEERTYKGMSDAGSGVGVMRDDAWRPKSIEVTVTGRWPAHLVLDEEAAAMLDEQSGAQTGSNGRKGGKPMKIGYKADAEGTTTDIAHDKGGASRFFYVAKGSRSEKDLGCEHLPKRTAGEATDREEGSAGLENPRAGAGRTGGARNFHPTVKSIALMRWLCRLITPPGGLVLDPFCGSGSTGVAALAEGFSFVGVERDLDDASGEALGYVEIAKARLEHALRGENK